MNHPSINEINGHLKKYVSPNTYKKQYSEFYKYLTKNYPFAKKFTEKLYCYFFKVDSPPTCPVCGSQVSFDKWPLGYHIFCSTNCARKGTREKACKTMKQRYGGVGLGSPEIKKKIIDTTVKKYGGVGFASPITNKKIRAKNLELYGNECAAKTQVVIDKIENTMLKKYGVRRALENPDLLKKSQDTLESHYGVRVPMACKSIRDKCIKNMTHTYRTQRDSVLNKINLTNMRRHGRDWGFDYDKVRATNLMRYGTENPLITMCSSGEIKYHGYSKISQECFHILDTYLSSYTTQYATKGGEHKFVVNDKNYYVDYYIEELNIAIEFNGDMWHANPSIYKPDDFCSPFNSHVTAKDVWEVDRRKIKDIESTGTKVIVLWESEYRNIDMDEWVAQHFKIPTT